MMDVTIPMIHTTGINTPVVAISVKIVCFMMTPSFPAHPAGLRWLIGDSRHDLAPALTNIRRFAFLYSINHAKIEKPA